MGKSATLAFVAAFAAVLSACADDVVAAEAAEMSAAKPHKWLSFNAYADFETALLCRGFVWDTHPFSVQYAEGDIDLDRFGRFSAYTWNMLAWSPVSHSGTWRYRYSEIDYGVRYAYDLELAEEWALNSGVAKQWVTFPGRDHRVSNSVIDWQVFQSLRNPYLVPYWRMRYIYKPFTEFYWIIGLKRTFPLFVEGLNLTLDLFGDLGDARHCMNIFGPKPGEPHSNYRGGLQSINAVIRLDYRITDHFGVFAFAGYYGILLDDARDAVDAMHHTDAKRDLAYGGAGITLDF